MHLKSGTKQKKVWIGELLVQKGLISQAQLTQALAAQRHTNLKLGEILIQQGLISHQQLQHVLNEQRWHNLLTAVMLSVSALVSDLPRLLYSQSLHLDHRHHATAIAPSSTRVEDSPQAIGGMTMPMRRPTNNRLQPSLPSYATVSSPLRGFCHPMNGQGFLSQGIRGTTHRGRMEYAYDLAVNIGTPVYAMRAGRVIAVRDYYPDNGGSKAKSSRFNYVWLEHDGGYRSAYIHLQKKFNRKINLKVGQWIEAKQLIGYSGNSGWSSGPHLHIEVQKPGEPHRFAETVPFEIASYCPPARLARQAQPVKQ